MRIGSLCLALASLTLGACARPHSNTDLVTAGAPEILQVFMQADVPDPTDPTATIQEEDLAFGKHIEACNASARPTPDVAFGGMADSMCNEVGPGMVTTASTAMGKIRIVFDELLKGSTVEQFQCACNTPPSDCGAGPTAALDPVMCPENPMTTTIEAGKWLDDDANGVPDKAELLPGLVTITCGATTVVSDEQTGFYNPSGNQLVPVAEGLADGVGPALVLTSLPAALPVNTDCTLTVSNTITDKDGNAPVFHQWDDQPAPTAVSFHTSAM